MLGITYLFKIYKQERSVHMGKSYPSYTENILTSLQATFHLLTKVI